MLLGGWVRLLLGWQDYYLLLYKAQPDFPPGFSTPRPFSYPLAL